MIEFGILPNIRAAQALVDYLKGEGILQSSAGTTRRDAVCNQPGRLTPSTSRI